MPESEVLVRVAAELLGAEVGGTARVGDLDRAIRAAVEVAGERLDDRSLAQRLRAAPPGDRLRRAFIGALTISETHFFRMRGQFEALAERVLPALIVARRGTRRLRLWSAGCSTGEEAWSLAILLERLVPSGWDATVLATDVDERALEHAQLGVYGPRSFREVPDGIRNRWFTATDGRWEVDPGLRRRVRFAALNLVTDTYPSFETGTGGVDLLLCRNVLIYFTPEARSRTAARLTACLAPGGWLAVAPAELSATGFPDLAARLFPAAILYQRPDPTGPPSTERRPPLPPARPAPPRSTRPPSATAPRPTSGPLHPPESTQRAADRLEAARVCADRGERSRAAAAAAEVRRLVAGRA